MTLERTLATQLFSCSFRNKLQAIYDSHSCEIAEWLLSKDNVGYDSTHVRNITINGDNVFTYLPEGRDCKLNDNETAWTTIGRTQGKIGRVVRKINGFADQLFSDSQLEAFVNYVKAAEIGNQVTFQVVSGSEIGAVYSDRDEYPLCEETNLGSLGGSCMNGEDTDYFEIYEDNAELLIALRAGHLVGRAILWTTTCGTKVMDRIYGGDATIVSFGNWAMENGYYRKRYQSYDEFDAWVTSDGEVVHHNFEVGICNDDYCYYPYMDTFSYRYNGHHANYEDHGMTGTARSTGGDIESTYRCEDCNDSYSDEDDLNYVDSHGMLCGSCSHYCDVNGTYYHTDEMTEVTNGNGYYVWVQNDHVYYSEIEGEEVHEDCITDTVEGVIHQDNAVYLHDDEYLHTNSDLLVMLDNGDYTNSDYNDTVTTIYDELILLDDATELTDGGYVYDYDAVETYNGNIEIKAQCVEIYGGEYALIEDTIKTTTGFYVVDGTEAVCDYTNKTHHDIDEMYTMPDGTICFEDDIFIAYTALGFTKVNGVWLSPMDLETVGLTTKVRCAA